MTKLKTSIKQCKDLFGDKCFICKRRVFVKKSDYAKHHTDYKNDMAILVCFLCHKILHFGKVWRHPIFYLLGKDKAPLEFAKRVIKAYKRAKKLK